MGREDPTDKVPLLSQRRRGAWAVAAAAVVLLAVLLAGCSPERATLSFSPGSLPDAKVGQRYEQEIHIRGNETPVIQYSVQNGLLPQGLSIERVPGSDNTGRIVGIPLVAGVSDFEVFVICVGTNVSGQTGTQAYRLTIT